MPTQDYRESDDSDDPDDLETDRDIGIESVETVDCPHCGREVYEQAELCPYCDAYISQEDAPDASDAGRHPRWVIITAILCLIFILLFWIL